MINRWANWTGNLAQFLLAHDSTALIQDSHLHGTWDTPPLKKRVNLETQTARKRITPFLPSLDCYSISRHSQVQLLG